jgi:bacterial/archaeal transporter family protein
MTWFFFALLSASAAAFTAILAKIGVEGVPSTLATAIRTVVVLVFLWLMVLGFQEQHALSSISRRSLVFLVLSIVLMTFGALLTIS